MDFRRELCWDLEGALRFSTDVFNTVVLPMKYRFDPIYGCLMSW
jgi:hypothetical protein